MKMWAKKVVVTCLFLAVILGVGFGIHVARAQDPDPEPLTVLRRIAWNAGFQDARHILTVPNPREISVGTATAAPSGVTFEVRNSGEIWMLWQPGDGQVGRNDFPVQIHNMVAPPFENWTGPLQVASETVTVEVYVSPAIHLPFLIGGPDILAAPVL